jgi:hypothetical protein
MIGKGIYLEELADRVYKEAMRNTIRSMRNVLRRNKIMKIYDLHLQTSK